MIERTVLRRVAVPAFPIFQHPQPGAIFRNRRLPCNSRGLAQIRRAVFETVSARPTGLHACAGRFGLSFILPFGFAAFYPATFFLPGADRAEFLIEFCLTPLVGLGVLCFGYWIWSLGVRRYESTGT